MFFEVSAKANFRITAFRKNFWGKHKLQSSLRLKCKLKIKNNKTWSIDNNTIIYGHLKKVEMIQRSTERTQETGRSALKATWQLLSLMTLFCVWNKTGGNAVESEEVPKFKGGWVESSILSL